MKANELRIGNYITDEWYDSFKTTTIVDSINERGINLNIEHESTWSELAGAWIEPEYEFDKIFGIPLTEEWLLKFGFERTGEDRAGNYSYFNGVIYLHSDFSLSLFNGHSDEHDTPCFSPELRYVHQLQNLYFALTGEELVRR